MSEISRMLDDATEQNMRTVGKAMQSTKMTDKVACAHSQIDKIHSNDPMMDDSMMPMTGKKG